MINLGAVINLFKRSKSAAVLGCGPAGLFAAHALIQNGWGVTVFSRKRPSDLYGCQYLHAPIPGLTDDLRPERVSYRLVGEVDGYREKVYGGLPVAVSPETLEADHDAWDIRAAYARAWGLYNGLIEEIELTPEALGVLSIKTDFASMSPIAVDTSPFDLIVNTVPLPALCYGEHEFTSTEIWAMGDAPTRGQYVPLSVDPFSVVCNGDRDTGWYRASNVFGYKTVEWPVRRKPPLPGVAKVSKPLRTNCNCYSDARYRWVNVGRYGSWTKGVLSHEAYQRAVEL